MLALLLLVASAFASDLLWGQYRPQVYFGLRAAAPDSMLAGLMWFNSKEVTGIARVRHETENSEEIAKLAHVFYDARRGGRQVVVDRGNGVAMYMDFIKTGAGDAWELRVRGQQREDSVQTVVFYAGSGNGTLGLTRSVRKELSAAGFAGDIAFEGVTAGKAYKLDVTKGFGAKPKHAHEHAAVKPAENSFYSGLNVPASEQWQARRHYAQILQQEVKNFVETYGDQSKDVPTWSVFGLDNEERADSNMHLVQKTFMGDFEFSVRFYPSNSRPPFDDFDLKFAELIQDQTSTFQTQFPLQEPFNAPQFAVFANELVSSVSGGIGYFYGNSVVQGTLGADLAPPHELLTTTPSRTFFPRGFYWDEGFTAMVLGKYDPELALKVIESWFNTADEEGYIQREQILGDEARTRVPEEFQVQDPSIANPPTLILALASLDLDKYTTRLRKLFPRLKTHFAYFRASQQAELELYDREYASSEVYRWRGKSTTHLFASGLDDYPRAPDVSDGEIHVDLMAWVAAAAKSLASLAQKIGEDGSEFAEVYDGVLENLERHWSDEFESFCDVSVDEFEEDALECHVGYVTLLPFSLKLVKPAETQKLLAILGQIRDEDQLWSEFGVRSLSFSDPAFGTGENYWRGAVWANMNYLILDALQFYAKEAEKEVSELAAQIYFELRVNFVSNVYRNWQETHSVWESYDGTTGAAKGAKSFSGWTSLTANIMAMPMHAVPDETNADADDLNAKDESDVKDEL